MRMFFDKGGMGKLLELLKAQGQEMGAAVHFVSAREMGNVIHAIEVGEADQINIYRNARFSGCFFPEIKKIG